MSDVFVAPSRNFDVEYFVVTHRVRQEQGKIEKVDVSPFFEKAEQAKNFKATVISQYPECYIDNRVEFFSSEDDTNRKDLLAKIIKA